MFQSHSSTGDAVTSNARNTLQTPRSIGGMSVVELLVALGVGLIACLAIFQVFAVFEGQKRTTTSGGDAQTNGALALFGLEHDLRQAGFGINTSDYFGCNVLAWDKQQSGGAAFTFVLAPVIITQGAAGVADSITVLYGTNSLLPNPAVLIQTMTTPVADMMVGNRYGFNAGDVVLAAETGKNCTLAQVSNLPTAAGQANNIVHADANYADPNSGALIPTRYNNPAGLGVSYTTIGRLFSLGGSPVNNVYTVQSGQLVLQQILSAASNAATPLFDGIVQLQAQYGKDTVGADGIIDVFDEITPTTPTGWAQVLAIRVALVARASQYEKNPVTAATIKLWNDSATAPTTTGPVWNLTADEQHYRYKIFQTMVPIRNAIWTP
jgi:type IV pilus assembly protein PilW